MALVILRVVFLMVAITIGFQVARSDLLTGPNTALPWLAFLGILACAGGVLAADVFTRCKRLDVITAIYFGAVIGLFLGYVLLLGLTPLLEGLDPSVAGKDQACAHRHGSRPAASVWLAVVEAGHAEGTELMRHASVETTRRHYAPRNVQRTAGAINDCLRPKTVH